MVRLRQTPLRRTRGGIGVSGPLHPPRRHLRLLTEITQRHVFDHALPQQADALIGHGILLSEPRLLTPDTQTGRAVSLPRSHQSQAPPGRAALYRESGFVLWPASAALVA